MTTRTTIGFAVRLTPYVAVGGAVGAILRHLVEWSMGALGGDVGSGLLVVNLLGSFLLGVVYVRVDPQGRPTDVAAPVSELGGRERAIAFAAAGCLGAFTTYSGLVAWLGSGFAHGGDVSLFVELLAMMLLGPPMVLLGLSMGTGRRSESGRRP